MNAREAAACAGTWATLWRLRPSSRPRPSSRQPSTWSLRDAGRARHVPLRASRPDGAAGGEEAQSLVEFALILPLILLLVLGLFDVARAVWQENTLAFAAREATRYAIVRGSAASSPIPYCASCTNSAITSVVEQNAIGVPNITVTLGYPDGNNDRNSRVFVDATAPFVPLPSQYLLNGALTITLRGGSMLVIQR